MRMSNVILKAINFLNTGGIRNFLASLNNEKEELVKEMESIKTENDNLKKELMYFNNENTQLKEDNMFFNEKATALEKENQEIKNTIYSYIIKKIDKQLNDNNIDDFYKIAKEFDDEGYEELKIVSREIEGDLYSTFYYEDNKGFFDYMNGYQKIRYYEKMGFSEITNSIFHGAYEECEYSDPSNNSEYENYKRNVKIKLIKSMVKQYPHAFLSKIS